jgi:hypothetical protein
MGASVMLSRADMARLVGSDNYRTDEWMLDLFENWYDPCPFNPNFDPDKHIDGLKVQWEDKTFVNPPYSNPLPWVRKAVKEHEKGKTIVMLLKNDSSTKWYNELHRANAHIILIHRRMKYQTGKAANFPSMLAILSKRDLL